MLLVTMSKLILILILTSYSLCSGYKFLLVFPFPRLSNSVLGEGYVRILLTAGHEVTYITPYPIQNAKEELRQIEVTINTNIYSGETSNITYLLQEKDNIQDIGTVLNEMMKVTNATVMHPNVQKLLNDDAEEFDAVIVEWMYSDVYAGFSSVFNCPLIWSSPVEPNEYLLSLLNEYPEYYSSSTVPATFWQRVQKQFRLLYEKFYRWLLSEKEKSVFNRAFGRAMAKRGGILPPFEVVKHNGSLLLGNSHFSTGQTFRLPLNCIQIAGYHIDEKRKPLSQNLQEIMADSKKGVVYFSTGTTLKSSTLPQIFIEEVLDVFKTVNMTVIWEYEGILKAPENVHVFNRVPQQSILAHPNCVLFITTGDLQSFIEAVHFGIPIIGIPILEDQFNNVDKAVDKGFGKKADIMNIRPLKEAMDDVIRNTKYRQTAEELSTIYLDRPIPPGKELLFWLEHVILTKGATHLRSLKLDSCFITPYFELSFVILTPIVSVFVLIVCLLLRRRRDDVVDFKKFI